MRWGRSCFLLSVGPESLFLAEQESACVAWCALHGDVCTGPIANHIHQVPITGLLNKVLMMLGELCDLNYKRTDFQSLENPGIHQCQGILKMLLFMQRSRQGEQGIKCSLVYVNISACSYFWQYKMTCRRTRCLHGLSVLQGGRAGDTLAVVAFLCWWQSQHKGIHICLVHRLLYHQVSSRAMNSFSRLAPAGSLHSFC